MPESFVIKLGNQAVSACTPTASNKSIRITI